MRNIGFAVVGCGTVSGYGHLPAIEALEGAKLVAVVDIDQERLKEVVKKYPQARPFTDYREALRLGEVDVVVVATLPSSHAEITLDSLRADKHVLVEKPPAMNVQECEAIVREAERVGRLCAVDFDLRYHPAFFQIREQYRKGRIGKLRAMRIIFDWYGADHRDPKRGREERLMREGSIMFGEGIHFIDMVRWITGSEFGKICCVGTNIQGYANPDHMVLISVMEDGTIVNIETSHGYGFASKDATMDRQVDLIGQYGVIKWTAEKGLIRVYGRDRTVEMDAPDVKKFVPLYKDLLESVREGKIAPNLPTIYDGYQALKVVEEADRVVTRIGFRNH
ncbi:MAG TPA: Gfo/Idh/MocA family oxidoreductase [Candidatus Latescibacteria bacterium]|nr:Gfo/Idh/MocA family oxidoreductase [Candidatus Latescibacterota bacterium]